MQVTGRLDLREEPAWDNDKYTNIYKHKFLQLQHNLKHSPVSKGVDSRQESQIKRCH
jgi:hypothetical protein